MDVTLFVNHQCNLACSYCYNGKKFFRRMPDDIMRRGVEMAFSGERARIVFFGGEPLMDFDLVKDAVAYAKEVSKEHPEMPLRFSMTTNGTLLDAEKIAFLAENQFHLAVSLDGNKAAHDLTRPFRNGRSSYKATAEAIRKTVEEIPSLEAISVVDPTNVEHLPDSFDTILSLGVKNLNFNMNYEGDWDDEALERLESALEELSNRYVREYREGRDLGLNIFDAKIISHLKGGFACGDRCKFGQDELCVAPSGNLYPCERLVGEDEDHDVIIGDVESGPDPIKILKMHTSKNTPDQDCEGCAMIDRCMFWCGCINYATTGDVGETSAMTCQFEQMMIQAADRAAAILYKEDNPLFLQKYYAIYK